MYFIVMCVVSVVVDFVLKSKRSEVVWWVVVVGECSMFW